MEQLTIDYLIIIIYNNLTIRNFLIKKKIEESKHIATNLQYFHVKSKLINLFNEKLYYLRIYMPMYIFNRISYHIKYIERRKILRKCISRIC